MPILNFCFPISQELRECIQPYFLRRMKSEVFNEDANEGNTKLSKKNEMIVWLRLTTCQVRSAAATSSFIGFLVNSSNKSVTYSSFIRCSDNFMKHF